MENTNENYGLNLTDKQVELIEIYLNTGKLNGNRITNDFEFAREIGTSVATIQLYIKKKLFGL